MFELFQLSQTEALRQQLFPQQRCGWMLSWYRVHFPATKNVRWDSGVLEYQRWENCSQAFKHACGRSVVQKTFNSIMFQFTHEPCGVRLLQSSGWSQGHIVDTFELTTTSAESESLLRSYLDVPMPTSAGWAKLNHYSVTSLGNLKVPLERNMWNDMTWSVIRSVPHRPREDQGQHYCVVLPQVARNRKQNEPKGSQVETGWPWDAPKLSGNLEDVIQWYQSSSLWELQVRPLHIFPMLLFVRVSFARIARVIVQEVMPLPFHAVESDADLQAWGCHMV